MKSLGAIFPLVVVVLAAGVGISIVGGSHAHWIWFLLALGVAAKLAGGAGR